jgi:hypothetical protein
VLPDLEIFLKEGSSREEPKSRYPRFAAESLERSKLRLDRSEQESGSKAALALVVFSLGVMTLSVPAVRHFGQKSRTVAVLYRSKPCKASKEGNKDGIESSIVSAVDDVGGITSAI